jgi:hypothetical protein
MTRPNLIPERSIDATSAAATPFFCAFAARLSNALTIQLPADPAPCHPVRRRPTHRGMGLLGITSRICRDPGRRYQATATV